MIFFHPAVRIPFGTREVEIRAKAGVRYVTHAVRVASYDPRNGATAYERVCIGRVREESRYEALPLWMYPSVEFFRYFPYDDGEGGFEAPRTVSVGSHVVIDAVAEDAGIRGILGETLGGETDFLLDLAAYCVTEEKSDNGFYEYESSHPLFCECMREGLVKEEWTRVVVSFFNGIGKRADSNFLKLWSRRFSGGRVRVSFTGYCFRKPFSTGPYSRVGRTDHGLIGSFLVAYDERGIPVFYDFFKRAEVAGPEIGRAEKALAERGFEDVGPYMMGSGEFMDDAFSRLGGYGRAFTVRAEDDLCGDTRALFDSVRGSFEGKEEFATGTDEVCAVTLRRPFPDTWDAERCVHVFFDPSLRAERMKRLYSEADREKAALDDVMRRGEPIWSGELDRFHTLSYRANDGEEYEPIGMYSLPHRRRVESYVTKDAEMDLESEYYGYFAVVTSEETTPDEALALWDAWDPDENLFVSRRGFFSRYIQTDADDRPRYLTEFVALIIRSEIFRTLREKDVKSPDTGRRMSVDEALRRLDGIKAERGADGSYALGGMDGTQEEILSAFGIRKEDFVKRAAETLRRKGG